MVHHVQRQKDFPYILFGGALSLRSDFRQTNGQLREKEANSSFVLLAMKTFCLFKVFPITLQFEKTCCLRLHMSLKSRKPSSCV